MTKSLSSQRDACGIDPDIFKVLNDQNEKIIELYNQQIEKMDLLISQTIKEDDEVAKNDELLQSITGIGPVIAAYLIAFSDNFTTFNDSRKFACYCGIAPFPNQSGTKEGRTRVNHMANKKIKSLLSNGIAAAIRWDEGINRYYHKKIAEGKHKGVVLNAVKNKLIHRAFAVIKRQTAYVKLAY